MVRVLKGVVLLPLTMIFTTAPWPGLAAPDDKIHGKFAGEYTFYSLNLGDTGPPTKKDTKVNLWLSGATRPAVNLAVIVQKFAKGAIWSAPAHARPEKWIAVWASTCVPGNRSPE